MNLGSCISWWWVVTGEHMWLDVSFYYMSSIKVPIMAFMIRPMIFGHICCHVLWVFLSCVDLFR
jgi:hypothetical protein